MPQSMTYASLVTDLEAYLQRQDALVVAQIPRFIMLAQQRLPRELKILGFREEVTGSFDGTAQSTGIMQKPSDWRKTIAFYVGTNTTTTVGTSTNNSYHTPVFERTYEFIRSVYPDPTQTNTPRFYADADWNHWLLGPSPDQAYPYKIAYYGTLTLLDATVSTNWLTVNAPDLLLYACLMEAIPFLKTDERIPVWAGMYQQAKAALMAQDGEGLYDRAQITEDPQTPPSLPTGRQT